MEGREFSKSIAGPNHLLCRNPSGNLSYQSGFSYLYQGSVLTTYSRWQGVSLCFWPNASLYGCHCCCLAANESPGGIACLRSVHSLRFRSADLAIHTKKICRPNMSSTQQGPCRRSTSQRFLAYRGLCPHHLRQIHLRCSFDQTRTEINA